MFVFFFTASSERVTVTPVIFKCTWPPSLPTVHERLSFMTKKRTRPRTAKRKQSTSTDSMTSLGSDCFEVPTNSLVLTSPTFINSALIFVTRACRLRRPCSKTTSNNSLFCCSLFECSNEKQEANYIEWVISFYNSSYLALFVYSNKKSKIILVCNFHRQLTLHGPICVFQRKKRNSLIWACNFHRQLVLHDAICVFQRKKRNKLNKLIWVCNFHRRLVLREDISVFQRKKRNKLIWACNFHRQLVLHDAICVFQRKKRNKLNKLIWVCNFHRQLVLHDAICSNVKRETN